MRVKVFTGGSPKTDASTFYRMVEPARVLSDGGIDVTVHETIEGVVWQDQTVLQSGQFKTDARVVGLQPLDCDIAVFQRPLMRNMADVIEFAAQQCTVVVDLDDDFQAVPPENIAHDLMDPAKNWLRNWDHLWRATRAADLITVTTEALARRYGKGGKPTAVLPNCIPQSYLYMPPPIWEGKRIGWTGAVETHPFDLEVTKGAVPAAINAAKDKGERWNLHVVGQGNGVPEALGMPAGAQVTRTGWVPLAEYPSRMSSMDIGIVPLHSCAFNHGKSYLKAIEFAALGVPVVMSPTQANTELHGHGVGLLARDARTWRERLTELTLSSDYRAEVAGRGKEAAARLTFEQKADDWYLAWASALAEKRVLALT